MYIVTKGVLSQCCILVEFLCVRARFEEEKGLNILLAAWQVGSPCAMVDGDGVTH